MALLEQFGLEGLCEVRYPRVHAQLAHWGSKPAQGHTSIQSEQPSVQDMDVVQAQRDAAVGHAVDAPQAFKSAV